MSKKYDWWVSGILLALLGGFLPYGEFFADPPEPFTPTYHEEAYTLLDGTPCTILRAGSTVGGSIGITCNYAGE